MIRLALSLALAAGLALPAGADVVDEALDAHVLPRIEALAETTAALAGTAEATCDRDALRPAWSDAFDAWAAASHLRLGPIEEGGQAVAFWPDDRDFTARGLRLLLSGGPDALAPDAMARASVAARGLLAFERLLWEAEASEAACAALSALAADLARTAAAIRDGWTGPDGFAATMRAAGAPGNTRFLAPEEAEAALYTALATGLEFAAEQRLGRPLGTFDRPRPARAEAWRSGSSLRAVTASLRALRELAALFGPAPRTLAALDGAIARAEALDDPALAGVAEPAGRIRVEALQSEIRDALRLAAEEIGAARGLPTGFNAQDGD